MEAKFEAKQQMQKLVNQVEISKTNTKGGAMPKGSQATGIKSLNNDKSVQSAGTNIVRTNVKTSHQIPVKTVAVKAFPNRPNTLQVVQKPGADIRTVKISSHVNCKRPSTVSLPAKKPDYSHIKPKVVTKFDNTTAKEMNDRKNIKKCPENVISKTVGKVVKIPTASKMIVSKNIDKKSVPNVNHHTMTKPDIIITEEKDKNKSEIKSNCTQNSELQVTKANIGGSTNINEVDSKPDILLTTQSNDHKRVLTDITKKKTLNTKLFQNNNIKSRKSMVVPTSVVDKPKINSRKSMLPRITEGTKSESVFERLYKPKIVTKKVPEQKPIPEKVHVIRKSRSSEYNFHLDMLLGKKPNIKFNQRRSISAVHFKRISKSEANNCIHKWGSIGEKLDKIDSKVDDEDVKDEKVVSAVKSERKKVQFMTPIYTSFNTPRPDELQARLKSWLQKRGKSLTSYHHLQCFGLHHLKSNLSTRGSMQFEDALASPAPVYDEENKENIALESDSDNDSISELVGTEKRTENKIDVTNWRDVSLASESVYNESCTSHLDNDCTLTPANSSSVNNVNDLLFGALNDLSTLLREGFDWQQAARWLRSIRTQFPEATSTAAYWECRAALEDARGNLTGSVECWKEAIAKGTEESVVDSNLDQLLNKFMQLKISPHSEGKQANTKLVDVKNVFKSTIIRFAVQQAKLRNKSNPSTPYTVTPVRRSARLSQYVSRTPLRLCDTIKQAATIAPEHVFTPNENFVHTP